MPDFSFEIAAPATPVCGIDEVGRGPWAGPVVAAAAILDPATTPVGLDDSKKLTAKRREALFDALEGQDFAIGIASVAEIDQINILNATYLAMRRAVAGLAATPEFALVDGNRMPADLGCPGQTIIKGDHISMSIAAASIIAKVTRDRMMADLAREWPGYGWEKNAGYGVAAHAEALRNLGVTPHHRRSFKPIHKMLCEEKSASH